MKQRNLVRIVALVGLAAIVLSALLPMLGGF